MGEALSLALSIPRHGSSGPGRALSRARAQLNRHDADSAGTPGGVRAHERHHTSSCGRCHRARRGGSQAPRRHQCVRLRSSPRSEEFCLQYSHAARVFRLKNEPVGSAAPVAASQPVELRIQFFLHHSASSPEARPCVPGGRYRFFGLHVAVRNTIDSLIPSAAKNGMNIDANVPPAVLSKEFHRLPSTPATGKHQNQSLLVDHEWFRNAAGSR